MKGQVLFLVGVFGLVWACSSASTGGSPSGAEGGASGKGGSSGKGGASGKGGSSGKGGTSGKGGSSGRAGASGKGGSAGTPTTCSLAGTMPDCNDCFMEKCETECLNVEKADGSSDFGECVSACESSDCEQACYDKFPEAGKIYKTFVGCIFSKCESVCPRCSLHVEGDTACNTCITNKCEDQCVACEWDLSCMSLLTCMNACKDGNEDCENDCFDKYTEGAAAYLKLLGTSGCLKSKCESECY